MFRLDPGRCPICGAAHTACTSSTGPVTVVQLPARDAAARALSAPPLDTPTVPADDATADASAPLGDGSDGRPFSTATYRGRPRRGSSSRP